MFAETWAVEDFLKPEESEVYAELKTTEGRG